MERASLGPLKVFATLERVGMMKGRYGARMEISHEPIVHEFVQRFVITGYLSVSFHCDFSYCVVRISLKPNRADDPMK